MEHLWPNLPKPAGVLEPLVVPRLLLMDGHRSHLEPEFLQWCLEHQIYPLVLPAHSSHILQPLDVGLFSPLSHAYSRELDAFTYGDPSIYVTKADFFKIFSRARQQAFTANNIISSFKNTGIVPFDNRIVLTRLGKTRVTVEDFKVQTINSSTNIDNDVRLTKFYGETVLKTPGDSRHLRHAGARLNDFRIAKRGESDVIEYEKANIVVQKVTKYAEQVSAELELALHEIQKLRQSLADAKSKPERSNASLNPKAKEAANTGLAAFYSVEQIEVMLQKKVEALREKKEDEKRRQENRQRKADGLPIIRKPRGSIAQNQPQTPATQTIIPCQPSASITRQVHFQLQDEEELPYPTTPAIDSGDEDSEDLGTGSLDCLFFYTNHRLN